MSERRPPEEPISEQHPALEATRRGQLADLPRRIRLTYRHHGARTVLVRVLTFPLRFTPWAMRLKISGQTTERRNAARAWSRRNARPVTIVIPSFGAAEEVSRAVVSVRRTTPAELVRIVVSDDAGPAAELDALRRIDGIELLEAECNEGFARNANRGIERARPGDDVILLNADVEAEPGWLESLQHAAYDEADCVGIVGARLLYPNGQIQHAGVERNLREPDWFDHRYRFKPVNHGPADVPVDVLAVTGACMYLKRDLLERIGTLDPGYPMAFEDVDLCLRAWEAGFSVRYEPAAILHHRESSTRTREPGQAELESQTRFWNRWRPFFDQRAVRTEEDKLRVVYVTERTDVGGGHRLIFEDLGRLMRAGHEVELYSLDGPPDWFELEAPVRTFGDYDELTRALAPLDAIKVATWWKTAAHVWRASVCSGIGVYYVQDIETGYYPDAEAWRHRVLASYRSELRYLTISGWISRRLSDLGLESTLVAPAVQQAFRPLGGTTRRQDMVLAIARDNPLKRFDLTVSAWNRLRGTRPELCVFGVEPEMAPRGARFVHAPSDEEVNRLLNECTVFVQTSSHEGFALPPLEAMAAGAAVVCTDADGNRDYCRDGVNCLMPAGNPAAIAAAVDRLLADASLRARLAEAGLQTAAAYSQERRAQEIEAFFESVARG